MSIDILDSAYTVWENGEGSPFGSIRFKRNTIFFDSSINLGPRIETPVAKSTPDVAASGNNVHVVWRDRLNTCLSLFKMYVPL
jgi:hypothetical protein